MRAIFLYFTMLNFFAHEKLTQLCIKYLRYRELYECYTWCWLE